MSTESRTVYKFKPFEFTVGEFDSIGCSDIKKVTGCNDAYFYMASSSNSSNPNSLFVESYWKCNFDSGQRKMIKQISPDQKCRFYSSIISGDMLMKINNSIAVDRNVLYLGNLAEESKGFHIHFKELGVYGDIPYFRNDYYSYIINDKHIYLIYRFFKNSSLEVRRLDLNTRKWELLYKSSSANERLIKTMRNEPKFTEKLIFYKGSIYIFETSELMTIFKFDIIEKKWVVIPRNPECWPDYGDSYVLGCVQYPEKSNMVYMIGILPGGVWRFNIDNLQWEHFKWITPKIDMVYQFTHTNFVTPSGRMCWYGEQIMDTTDNIIKDTLVSAWITIPKLKLIVWEAMIYYFKKPMLASSYEHLSKIGIPKEFCEQLIEGRRTNM